MRKEKELQQLEQNLNVVESNISDKDAISKELEKSKNTLEKELSTEVKLRESLEKEIKESEEELRKFSGNTSQLCHPLLGPGRPFF